MKIEQIGDGCLVLQCGEDGDDTLDMVFVSSTPDDNAVMKKQREMLESIVEAVTPGPTMDAGIRFSKCGFGFIALIDKDDRIQYHTYSLRDQYSIETADHHSETTKEFFDNFGLVTFDSYITAMSIT